jgi:hypothetical protein
MSDATFDNETGEIVRHDSATGLAKKPAPIQLHKTGLTVDGQLSFDDWHDFGQTLQQVEGAIQWWIGDWLNYGEQRYGEMYTQAIEDTDFAYSTLAQYKRVAKSLEFCLRRQNLTWSHHKELASLEPDEQEYWLGRAESETLSVAELRREIKAAKALARLPEVNTDHAPAIEVYDGDALEVLKSLPIRSFDLLLTDPPYNTQRMDWDTWENDDDFVDWTRRWLTAAMPLMKTDYNAFVFCSPHNAPDIEMGVLRPMGIRPKSRIIWSHRNMSMGRVVSDRFINTYDVIFHFGTRALNWPPDWDEQRFDVQVFAAPQTNFEDTKLHQTQKPVELIKLLCSIGSAVGERVLDPFSGSGTTGVACLELGRDCVMIDNAFADLSAKRVGMEVKRAA